MATPVNQHLFTSGPLSGDEARRLGEQLEHASRQLRVAPPLYINGFGGVADLLQLDVNSLLKGVAILAKITAVTGSDPYHYDFTEQTIDPTTGDVSDLDNGRSGTYAETNGTHALELTDTLVAVDTLVLIRQLANGVRWFDACDLGCEEADDTSACDLAKLKTTDCLLATGPFNSVYLVYDSATWVSTEDLVYSGAGSPGPLVFSFSGGALHLSLDGMELLNCGNGCWRGGPLTGHTSDSGDACGGATFEVCLSCACCSIAGWDGPGWYCADIGDGCEPLLLTEDDRCDGDITICSGPYPSEEAATVACGEAEGITYPCGGTPGNYAVVTSFAISAASGDTGCHESVTATQNGPINDAVIFGPGDCEAGTTYTLSCVDGFYELAASGCGSMGATIAATLVSASPTELVYFVEWSNGCLATYPDQLGSGGGAGSCIMTLTGTFP